MVSIDDLRNLCASGSVRWTDHVLKRLLQRGITQADTLQAVMSGEIIEQYPEDYPYPSCLVPGFSVADRVLHVVWAR